MTDARTRTVPRVAGAALLCLVVLGLLAARLALGAEPPGLVLDLVLALAAVAATLRASRRARPGRSRAAWRCQAAGYAVWALAPAAWLTPLPDAVAWVARVAFVVLVATGWWLTSLGADPRSRVRLLVDSALAATGGFIIGWPLGLAEVWREAGPGPAGAVAVGVTLGAAGVAVLATGLAMTEMRPSRRPMPLLTAGALLLVAYSDGSFGRGGAPVWAAAWALVVVATLTYAGTSERREVRSTRRALVLAPYALLAPAVVGLVLQQLRGGVPTPVTTATAVVGALLLARQHVTLAENRRLVERLADTERLLRHQVRHDALTGLPVRVVLAERLEAALARRRDGDGGPCAVLFVDLDDFKAVNDTLGHAAGDDVLVQTARRLRSATEALDGDATAVRISGDEFAVLLTGPVAGDAEAVAARIAAALREPMTVNGRELVVAGSVGWARAEDGQDSASALLRAADVAMYGVKRARAGRSAPPPDVT